MQLLDGIGGGSCTSRASNSRSGSYHKYMGFRLPTRTSSTCYLAVRTPPFALLSGLSSKMPFCSIMPLEMMVPRLWLSRWPSHPSARGSQINTTPLCWLGVVPFSMIRRSYADDEPPDMMEEEEGEEEEEVEEEMEEVEEEVKEWLL